MYGTLSLNPSARSIRFSPVFSDVHSEVDSVCFLIFYKKRQQQQQQRRQRNGRQVYSTVDKSGIIIPF